MKTLMVSTQAKHTALMSRINAKARLMRADGKGQLRGRQCLFLIKRYFAVDNSEDITFELKSLMEHHYDGDENLEPWQQHWDYLMEHQETPLTSKQAETIYYGHVRTSKILANYIQYYERLSKGDKEKTYEYLDESTNKVIDERRERLNLESCAAGRAYVRGKHTAPGPLVDDGPAVTPAPGGGKDAKARGKGKDPKGKGKGDKGQGSPGAPGPAGAKSQGKGKGKVNSEGRPLRCVHHWFGQCKNHPLKDGETCRFGPHVPNPREDEKLRPQFLKMESIHGKWEKGKFNYPKPSAAAKKAAKAGGPAADGNAVETATPAASPRGR